MVMSATKSRGWAPGELADREVGYAYAWQAEISEREWALLETHAAFWARAVSP
jgi:hypothetical protein